MKDIYNSNNIMPMNALKQYEMKIFKFTKANKTYEIYAVQRNAYTVSAVETRIHLQKHALHVPL